MRSISRRSVAFTACCALLVVLLVGHGTLTPDPAAGRFPGNDAVAAGTVDDGGRVVVAGVVEAETADGTVVALGEGSRITVRGLDAAPDTGVWLYGTYRDGAIRNRRAIVRAQWEHTYLYAVSLLGGLLTLGRVVRTWRVDADTWQLVPRGEDRG